MRFLALAPLVVLVASPALADDVAKARKLFTQGLELEEAGKWGEALSTFKEVAAIRVNHIVRFHIALCLEKTGKLVEAIEQFALAKAQAEKEGGTDAELTVANSKKHLDILRMHVPALKVQKPGAPGARLTIDGETQSFDAVVPMNPGAHVVVVDAPDHTKFERSITLVDGNVVPVDVAPNLEPVTTPGKGKEPTKVVTDVSPPDRTWSYVLGGVGLASLAAAGVFYGLRSSTLHDLEASCDPNGANCDPSKRDLDDRGRTYTVAGNVLLGVGVVAVGAAVTLYVLTPTPKSQVALVGSPTAMSLRIRF